MFLNSFLKIGVISLLYQAKYAILYEKGVRLAWHNMLAFVRLEWYITDMILSPNTIQYFQAIASKVIAAMANQHSKSPYYVDDDPIIQHYECIRSVWRENSSIKEACANYHLSRSQYYLLEKQFVIYGIAGLFTLPTGYGKQSDIEDLVLLIKECKPHLSQTGILRICEAVPLTSRDAQVDTISKVLYSHGYGQANLSSDREFWGRIQRSILELLRMLQTPIGVRDPKHRRDSFFIDADPCHKRLECLRELYYYPQQNIQTVCMRYNVPVTGYYRLLRDYQLYGPWAIIRASSFGKNKILSSELQLRIILEKLRNPGQSSQQLVDKLNLHCSRFIVNRILKRWQLDTFDLRPAALDQYIDLPYADVEERFAPIKSAYHILSEESILSSRRINRHFELICWKMRTNAYHICDPGVFLLAPFVNDLSIVQSFETYGPPRLRGKEITNLALLNVFRILSGYRRIHHLSNHKDRSVALVSGIGYFGSSSRFYEDTIDFKFDHIYKMKLDLVARAKELGLIRGVQLGFDFHLKQFYGRHAAEHEIGKGPSKAGNLVSGFRPHVAWDLATNVIVSIAYYQGAIRSSTIIRMFCEQYIFPIFDRLAIEEIYMDSEYTKEGDFHYFKEVKCPNGEIYVCLKQNKQIKKIIQPALDEKENWIVTKENPDDEYKVIKTQLPRTRLPLMIVILRKRLQQSRRQQNIRCFGTTNMTLHSEDLLKKYRFRWNTENGIKDLVHSYFLDEIYGKDPEKIDFEFYCVMVARLAYEYFLKTLGGTWYHKNDGNRFTLDSMRHLLFEKNNCKLEQNSKGNFLLTFLDNVKPDPLLTRVAEMFDEISKLGINKVLWWNNRGLEIESKNQFS